MIEVSLVSGLPFAVESRAESACATLREVGARDVVVVV